jgi:RES domain-containing protein
MRVWRILKSKYSDSAFSGEGARLFDARWNFAGVPMVYTSSSLALAAVEYFVHLDPSDAPIPLVSVMAEVPGRLKIEQLDIKHLPRNWRRTENEQLQKLGTDWVGSGRSVALVVPSAAVQGEWNVLVNPAHSEFEDVRIAGPQPFRYDDRMFKDS